MRILKQLVSSLALLLSLSLALSGCDGDNGASSGGGNGGSVIGTWKYKDAVGFAHTITFKSDGVFETTTEGKLMSKGSYSVSGNKITDTTTHIHGDTYAALGLASKWYSETEFKSALSAKGVPESFFTENMGMVFLPEEVIFSISGNKMTATKVGGDTVVYTRS
jgi:hypothetical protein